jgi:hypothetical protein
MGQLQAGLTLEYIVEIGHCESWNHLPTYPISPLLSRMGMARVWSFLREQACWDEMFAGTIIGWEEADVDKWATIVN